MKFWTMTDHDGAGYINNCLGDTIIKTIDYQSAVVLCEELNNNRLIIMNFKPINGSIKKVLMKGD